MIIIFIFSHHNSTFSLPFSRPIGYMRFFNLLYCKRYQNLFPVRSEALAILFLLCSLIKTTAQGSTKWHSSEYFGFQAYSSLFLLGISRIFYSQILGSCTCILAIRITPLNSFLLEMVKSFVSS